MHTYTSDQLLTPANWQLILD